MGPGSALAFASAITFATSITLVVPVYEDGGNVHAVNLSRALCFAAAAALILAARRVSPALPPRAAGACMLVGLLFTGEVYGLVASIQYIPVGLSVLIMYTYPLIVAAYGWLSGAEAFTLDRLLALLAAFTGLILALYAPGVAIDWRGVAWAGFTALSFAAVVIASGRAMRAIDRRVMMFYLTGTTATVVGLVSLTVVDLEWPRSGRGFAVLGLSSTFYVLATVFLFAAIRLIGPLRTAIIDNSSPVWTVLLAAFLLGELLSPAQLFGGALVIGAVLLVQVSLHVPVRATKRTRPPASARRRR